LRKLCIFTALLTVLALLQAGCGGSGPSMEPADIAKAILEQVDFKHDLVPAEGDALENRYILNDKVADFAIYYDGGGGSAEEIAVLKASGAGDIKHLEDILSRRLENLAFSFENYRPNEMQKIKNPVIVKKGGTIVMVLADDAAAAEEVISSLLG